MGTMDRWPDMTNTVLIMDSLLFKYVGALPVYKCPADRKTRFDSWGGKGGPLGAQHVHEQLDEPNQRLGAEPRDRKQPGDQFPAHGRYPEPGGHLGDD